MVSAWGAALGKSMVDLALRSERPILRWIFEKNNENQFVVRGNGTRITMTTSCVGDSRYKTQDSIPLWLAPNPFIFHHPICRSERRETRLDMLKEADLLLGVTEQG